MTAGDVFEHNLATSTEKPTHKPVKDHVPITCLILRETQMAVLVKVAPWNYEDEQQHPQGKDEWFPLSQVSYINNIQDVLSARENAPYTDTIHVAKWLCDKKGLDY